MNNTQLSRRRFLSLASSLTMAGLVHAKPTSKTTGLVLDQGFSRHHISNEHPESPARYQAITEQLLQNNLLDSVQLIKPKKEVAPWLSTIHSTQHIQAIKSNTPDTYKYALLATGGVLAAVDAVCTKQVDNAFCASRPPGHHATNTGKEEGFCYFNHIAIAARYAQQQYHCKNILIIDWDYHHGNGTEWAFYSDPSVLFFSTHDMLAYPGTGLPEKTGDKQGKGFNINVHLPCGAGDTDIVTAFEQKLVPALETFSPDLILISAGFDSREDDLLGCHTITDAGFTQLTQIVKTLADTHCQGKIVSLLEGGYNIQGNASAVAAHIKALMA